MSDVTLPTPAEVEGMRERHVPVSGNGGHWCATCADPTTEYETFVIWPCDAARLLALVDRLPSVEQVAEVHEAHTFAGTKDIVALCSCGTAGLVNALNEAPAWHRRHQAEQVVALWGAL